MTRVAALLLAAGLTGCGAIASIAQFDIDFPADGAIPSGVQTVAFNGIEKIGSSMSETMSTKGVSSFKSAKFTTGSLSVSAANAQHMHFIQGFKIEVSAPDLPTVQVAHQDAAEFAKNTDSVPLIIDDVELKPYFKAPQVTFTATPTFQGRPPVLVPLHLDLKAHVQVL